MSDIRILLAEDDDGHATLIRRNIRRARLDADVVRVTDGAALLDHLAEQAADRPTVVLLDISMPCMDGVEVLRRLRADPVTRSLPVFMLTTTDNPAEVERCFALGCNAYLTKPVAYDAFAAAIERLCAFLEVTQFPAFPPHIANVPA